MAKKILLVLVLLALSAGVVFSQEEFSEMGKNTITVDIGPTLMGLVFGGLGDAMGGGETGISSWGFGIAAQYERQLLKSLSVAGRFSYLGGGLGYRDSSQGVAASLGIDINAISIEGHVRFYPGGKVFFLDGMLGYANLTVKFSGAVAENNQSVSVVMDATRGFFLVGGKLGWRIKFGSSKVGFTFEPSLGYQYGISSDDTIWTQVAKRVANDSKGADDIRNDDIENLFNIVIQDLLFIGGPKLGLAFGCRF